MNIVSHNWKRKKENNIEGASARSVLRRPFRNEKQGEISKKKCVLKEYISIDYFLLQG